MQLNADDLSRLQAKAEQTDSAATPQQPGSEGQAADNAQLETLQLTLDAEMAMLMNAVVKMLTPAFPSLGSIYTPEVIQGLSATSAAVCNKHGWLQNGIGGKYAEELALGFMVLPIGMATYKGVTADISANKAKKPAENKQPDIEIVAHGS